MRFTLTLILCIMFIAPVLAVDGVIEINQASVSSNVNTLHTISSPGSYRLTSDLIAPEDFSGIRVNSADVTLDLNGFTISGSGAALRDGISIVFDNIEVRNGTVRGFGRHGIFSTLNQIRIIDIRSFNNVFGGIQLESATAGLVRGCTVAGNGGPGIRVLSDGSLVIQNVVRDNGGEGLKLGATTAYGENVVTGNNSGDVQVSSGMVIACNLIGNEVICPP